MPLRASFAGTKKCENLEFVTKIVHCVPMGRNGFFQPACGLQYVSEASGARVEGECASRAGDEYCKHIWTKKSLLPWVHTVFFATQVLILRFLCLWCVSIAKIFPGKMSFFGPVFGVFARRSQNGHILNPYRGTQNVKTVPLNQAWRGEFSTSEQKINWAGAKNFGARSLRTRFI